MDIKAVSYNTGQALLVSAIFMGLSAAVSALNGFDSAFVPLVISFVTTFTAGCFPFIFIKSIPTVSLRDGYITIGLSWLLSFIFGMLPYVLWGGEFTIVNAWFESVSGYTTTGSTILTDIEDLPKSLLFWRSSTHFIGGLGVIVFLLLVMPDASPFRLKLTNLEISSISREGYRYSTKKMVGIICTVYASIAILETICLMLAGMSFFDAVNHAFSTVSTGGFSTRNSSIMGFNSNAINIIMMVFMFLSACHFGIMFAVVSQRSFRPVNSIMKYFFSATVVISLAIMFSLKLSGTIDSWGDSAMAAFFHTISFITTTGFGQTDTANWPMFANILIILCSIHCGCSGSTTGGLKSDRVLLGFKIIRSSIKKRLHPSSICNTRIDGHVISDETQHNILTYIVLYFGMIIISTVMTMLCGLEISEAVSGSIASLGNVGPGIGNLGTMGNFAAMPATAKVIFTLDMFFGRVEIYPLLVCISMIFHRN